MKTLLLRLEGPMQSWGVQSRFPERFTGFEPTKSGVIGLLCAALGKPRSEQPEHTGRWPTLHELTQMKMGVRLDQPGQMAVDFQTAGGGLLGCRQYGVARADGSKGDTVTSRRFYLQDASFLVGFESSNEALLERLHAALCTPVWPLYLGRKSYIPSRPVLVGDGPRNGGLLENLSQSPLAKRAKAPIRLVYDDPSGGEIREDVPLDFDQRLFSWRVVSACRMDLRAFQRPSLPEWTALGFDG